MDAKVDDWVVTPRRGKAVELNALWYNALCLLGSWVSECADATGITPAQLEQTAAQTRKSFNERFWYEDGGYCYDIVYSESGGNDAAGSDLIRY